MTIGLLMRCVLLVLLASGGGWPAPAGAQAPLGTAQIQVLGLGVDLDTRPDLPGVQYTMTAVRDIPTGLLAIVGSPDAPAPLSSFPVGSLVKAEISGPGFAQPVAIAGFPNKLLELPTFRIAGDYTVFNVRLESPDGQVLLRRDPALDLVVVNVIDQLLVTQVTSRPLTQEEIIERGIVIDEDNFTVLNFTVGLTLGSQQVTIELPTVIPNPGNPALTQTTIPRIPQIQLPPSTFDEINIPNFSLTGFSVIPPPELEEESGIRLPPIQGIILIPGNIAFLNQFFSVIVQTANLAPEFSGLVVNNARAIAALPRGDDNILGSGDDPLRIAETQQGTFDQLPLLDATGQPRIPPAQTSAAEFLIEGLREGTHVVDFKIQGDLFVPQLGRSFEVNGLAAGVVQVKNPTFSVTLAHPETVREGEAYSIFATVTNTSAFPANLFKLRLNNRSLSGARLADGDTGERQLATLAAGQAESFEFHLIARTTGRVSGTVFLADPGVNGSFILTTGVGDTGIPLSPDTLVLPKTVDYLPETPDLVFAIVRMLGQAYSVATAPAGALPSDIGRINKSFVFDRAVKLAQVGLHVRLGEAPQMAVQDLLLDLMGNDLARLAELYPDEPQKVERLQRDWEAFDALRRRADAGLNLTRILAESLAAQAGGDSLAQMMGSMATRFASRPPAVAFGAEGSDDALKTRIIDRELQGLGALASDNAQRREIPYADVLDLKPGSGDGAQRLLFIGAQQSPVYLFEFQSPGGGPLVLNVTLQDTTAVLSLVYPQTTLQPGATGRMIWREGATNAFVFDVDQDADGVAELQLAPLSITPVADAPPGLIAAHQWMKGAAPTTRVSFDSGDPLGRLFAVLFDEEVDAATAQDPAHYAMPEHRITQVVLQPDRRVVFVLMDKPAGPFVPREVAVDAVEDMQGRVMSGSAATPLVPDPERGVGGVAEGRLIDAEGVPLAGVEVRYIQPVLVITNIEATVRDRLVASYVTDADGRFTIDFVLQDALEAANSDIWLNQSAAGGTDHFKLEATDPGTRAAGRASTRVFFDGQRLAVNLIVRGSGSLQGHLFTEDGQAHAGRAPDDLNPLYAFATNLSTGERSFTYVDASGFYAFPRSFVDGEGKEFDVAPLSVGNILVQVVDPVTATTGIGTVNIPRAGAAATLDLIMSPANRFGRVTGRVLEHDGQTGAANTRVFVSAPVVTGFSLTEREVKREAVGATTTDAAGNFTFENVPIGDLRLRALRQETFEQVDGAAFLETGGEAFVTLVLPGTGGTVRGLVRDALGQPVPHAPVAGGPTLTEADDQGFFEITNLPLGEFTITARDTLSRATGRQQVEILAAGDLQEIVITLEPVGSISGSVFGSDGVTPLPNQRVQLWVEPGKGVIGEMKTDAQGHFEFINFPVGPYTIRAIARDRGDGGMANAVIRFAGDQVDADVYFRGLGEIKGRVIQSNGTPVLSDVVVTHKVWRIIPDPGSGVPNYYLDFLAALSSQSDELSDLVDGALERSGYTQNTNDFFFLLDESAAISSNILGPGGEVTGRFHFTGDVTGGPFTVAAFGPFLAPAVVEGEIPRTTNPAERIVDVGDIVLEPAVGSVRGTVFMPDGVTTVGANVRVLLRSLDNSGEVPAAGGGVIQPVLPEIEVVTDADGSYVFPLVLRGSAVVTADTGVPPPGLAAQTASEVFTDTFETTDGQRLLNVRLYGQANGVVPRGEELQLNLRLQEMAGMRVTVLQSDGVTTAPAAQVSLRTASTLDTDEEATFQKNTTDAQGSIEFFPVIEGNFSVEATLPGSVGRGVASGQMPANPPPGFVLPVKVVLGAATSAGGQVTATQLFGTVQGTVFRADGTTLTNPAEVRVRSGGVALLTSTNAQGRFSVDLVPGGFFTVDAFEPLTARRGSGSGRVTADGQTVDVPITLVGLGTVNGSVLDFDGQSAIPAADITLFPSGNFSAPLIARSDPSGRFTLPGVPLGSYLVKAVDPVRHLTGEAAGFMPADGANVVTDVLLEAAASIRGTVYAAGVTLNAQGVPVGPENVPLVDAPVVPGALVTLRRGDFTQVVQADGQGVFVSGSALLLGTYQLTARPPLGQDGATAQATLTFNGQQATANLALRGQGSVRGVVLDSLGLTPVAAARVTLTSQSPFSSGPISRFTDADGRFTIEGIPVGPVTLSAVTTTQVPQLGASAQGTLAQHGAQLVFEDGDADTEHQALRLQQAGGLVGTIVLDDGVTPALDAVIELRGPGGMQIVHVADAQGQFEYEGLPLGAYTLMVSEPLSNGRAIRQVTLVSNGVTLDLGLIATDSVRLLLVATTPGANALGVQPTAPIQLQFSEQIDPASVKPETIRVLVDGQVVAGQFSVSPTQPLVSFIPSVPFADLKTVSITVRADKLGFQDEVLQAGVRDLAGLSLAADYAFSFTTGDGTPPVLVSLTPTSGSVEVAVASVVRFEFNEPVDPTSIGSVALIRNGVPVAGTLNTTPILGGRVVVFTPAAALAPDAVYLTTLMGPVRDLNGNAMVQPQLAATFRTIDTVPPVIQTFALEGGVATTGGQAALFADFADPADVAFVEFYLNGSLAATDSQGPFRTTFLVDPALGTRIVAGMIAVDHAGNRSTLRQFVIDVNNNQLPAVQITSPAAGQVSQGAVINVQVRATDDIGVAQVGFTANDGAVAAAVRPINPAQTDVLAGFQFTVPDTIPPGGLITLRATAQDILGASAPSAPLVLTVVDNLAPTVTILSPANNATFDAGATVNVTVRGQDAGGINELKLDTSGALTSSQTQPIAPALATAQHTFSFTIPSNASPAQSVSLTARAKDVTGNTRTAAITLRIADRNPPQATLSFADGATLVEPGKSATINLNVTDEIGVTSVSIAAGALLNESRPIAPPATAVLQQFTLAVPANLPLNTVITVQGAAVDSVGNLGQAAPITLTTADLTPPQVSLLEPLAGASVAAGSTLTVRVGAGDNFALAAIGFSAAGAATDNQEVAITPVTSAAERSFTLNVPANAQPGQTIIITGQARDAAGRPANSAAVTVSITDTLAPTVVGVTPADGSTNVPLGSLVLIDFSKALDPATIGAITLSVNGQPVAGQLNLFADGLRVAFDPAADLTPQTVYTLGIATTLRDLAGNALATPFTSQFTTVALDTVGPKLLSINPPNGEPNVPLSKTIVAVFDEPLAPASVTATSFRLLENGAPVAATFSFDADQTIVRMQPQAGLKPATAYQVQLTNGIHDSAGNALTDGAGQPLVTPLQFTFQTGSFGITQPSADGEVVENTILTIESRQGTGFGVATVTYTVNGLALTPATGPNFAAVFNVPAAAQVPTLTIRAAGRDAANVLLAEDEIIVRVVPGLRFEPRLVGIPTGGSIEALLSIPSPLPNNLAISLAVGNPLIASVPASVLIPAGQTQVALTLNGLTTGSTHIQATSLRGNPSAFVSVSTPVAGRSYTALAEAIDGTVLPAITLGTLYLPPDSNRSVQVPLLDAPALALTPVTTTSSLPSAVTITGPVLIGAGSRMAAISLATGPTGESTLGFRVADRAYVLQVIIGEPQSARQMAVLASPVAGSVLPARSAGRIFIVENSQQTLQINLLSSPAPAEVIAFAESSDPAIASLVGAATVPAGSTVGSVTIAGGTAGRAELLFSAGLERRLLEVIVGPANPNDVPTLVAAPVGGNALPAPSVGTIFLPANSVQTVGVTILDTNALITTPVSVISGDPAIADVLGVSAVPAGSRSVALQITTGPAGSSVLTLQAAGVLRELTVIVGPPSPNSIPALLAQPIGGSALPLRSVGTIFMAPDSVRSVRVRFLDAPLPGPNPVAVLSNNGSVAQATPPAIVATGSTALDLTIVSGAAGTAELILRGADGTMRLLSVVVGTPSEAQIPMLFAAPVGGSAMPAPSLGSIFLPANSSRDVTVAFLPVNAALMTPVTVLSDNPGIAVATGSPVVPGGSRSVTLTITTGPPGVAIMTLLAGDIRRELTVWVGPPPPNAVPTLIAAPVAGAVVPVPLIAELVLPENSNVTVGVKLLAAGAATQLPVQVVSEAPATAQVTSTPSVAAGQRVATFAIATGPAGRTRFHVQVDGLAMDIDVIVTSSPQATAVPAIIAPPVGLANTPVETNAQGALIFLDAEIMREHGQSNTRRLWSIYE